MSHTRSATMSPVGDSQVLLVGVGGQGVLTAAQILGAAAHAAQLPVIVGQLHGIVATRRQRRVLDSLR